MNDLIDRQAASYALNTIRVSKNETWYSLYKKVLDVFSNLPSAEPELDEWCTDCKEYDQERHCCPRWNRVIRNTLEDAGQERKKGRWIEIPDGYGDAYYVCSECDCYWSLDAGTPTENGMNFCPNCGANMRGE